MELLRIEGTREDLRRLREVPGVHLVSPSAVDRGDGTWLVSAYAPDGAADDLRSHGLTVRRLKDAAQLRDEWEAAAPAEEALAHDAGPRGYLTSVQLAHRLDALAAAHPRLCKRGALPHRTHEGREVPFLRLGTGHGGPVVVIGGVHAREWAPPDALLSLAERLAGAYSAHRPLDHPDWIDRSARPAIRYAAWSIPAADIKRLLDGVTLLLVPLVNPDGRDFSIGPARGADALDLHRMWRKNRRPPAAGHRGPWCHGVDINRNFDVAWDFDRYYNAAAAGDVQSSKDACDPQIYIGPSAASEPETLNVQSLVHDQRPTHFLDIHSYARDILFPWGMDDDQGRDPSESFHNPDWDRSGPHGGRDGVGGAYGEYLPADLAAAHHAIARRMRDAIRDQAGRHAKARHRSTYTIKQSLGLYPTTGTSDDYCVALALLDGSRPLIRAFTLECGIDQAPDDATDDEGGFHPDHRTKFPKIEREVHAAVLALAGTALPP